jgi:hypothetical protein
MISFKAPACQSDLQEALAMTFIYLAGGVAFFFVSALFVGLCERLRESGQ